MDNRLLQFSPTRKYLIRLKKVAEEKRSSLFWKSFMGEEKSFMVSTIGANVIKLFSSSLELRAFPWQVFLA